MLISILIFVLGLIYALAGIFCLYKIDSRTQGRALAWVSGILMLELLTILLWPLAVIVHLLDCLLHRALRLSYRGRV